MTKELNMTIAIVAVTRSNKGKGVTITCKQGDQTRDFVIRKTGGEKYGKVVLYTTTPEHYAQTVRNQEGGRGEWPCFFSIHKPTTRVTEHAPWNLAQVFEF